MEQEINPQSLDGLKIQPEEQTDREAVARIICESQEGEEWEYCLPGQKEFCYLYADQILSLLNKKVLGKE